MRTEKDGQLLFDSTSVRSHLYLILHSSKDNFNINFKMDGVPFPSPVNMMLCGPSQSGKSTFLIKLIENRETMFEKLPDKILIAYKSWQPLYEKIKDKADFTEGLPDPGTVKSMCEDSNHCLLVLDDLMAEASQSKDCEIYSTVGSHHWGLTVITLSQNVFYQGKHSRTKSLNTHIFVLFRNLRDKTQYGNLAKQAFPGKVKNFMEILEDCLKKPYGYLVLDCYPRTEDIFRLRTSVLPGETAFTYCIKE